MQRRNLIVQNHIRTIKRGDKKGGVDTMVDETIRSIKEAEQQAEEILVKAQGQKEQILKGASLQAKQIHEELIEEAKELPVDWMRKPVKRRKIRKKKKQGSSKM